MSLVLNDETNIFGMYGLSGTGPGKHTKDELLSTIKFGGLINKINYINSRTVLPRLSEAPHFSCFYGRVVFRNLDGTVSGFLDTSYANSGLNIQPVADYVDTARDWIDTSTDCLTIPISSWFVPSPSTPSIMLSLVSDSTRLDAATAEFYKYDTTDKLVFFKLFNLQDHAYIDASFMQSLADYEATVDIFGVKNLSKDII